MSRFRLAILCVTLLQAAAARSEAIGVTGLISEAPRQARWTEIEAHRQVRDVIPAIRAVTIRPGESRLPVTQALPFVASTTPQVERERPGLDPLLVGVVSGGSNESCLDAVETRVIVPFFTGTLVMDCVATPTANGWTVEVRARPRGVHFEGGEDIVRYTLHGTGTGAWTAIVNEPTGVAIVGMHWQSQGGIRLPATFYFTISVDTHGVVRVH